MAGGCGKGRGSGRSNKGRGNKNNWNRKSKNSSENNKVKKKHLLDCIYSVGTASQTSKYETIMEYLINHIKKTYKWGGDIAQALTTKIDYNFNQDVPTEGTVDKTISDSNLIAKSKESLKLIYKQEIKRYVDRKLEYSTNKIKAYIFLINQCNKAMVAKIKQYTNFASTILRVLPLFNIAKKPFL